MLGALIGAGASLLGGYLSNKSAKKQAAEQNRINAEQQRQQYEQQKEFAQSGIQWKVEDATKAGIHPLYALGANTVSYSPQQVGGQSAAPATDYSFLADAGQNVGRAINATRSGPAKLEALALTASQIQLEGLKLDNDLKRAQLASSLATTYQTGVNPGLPNLFTSAAPTGMEGQGNAPQLDLPNHEFNKPRYTPNIKIGGKNIQPHPGYSDAQTIEDRYGDESIASFILNQIIGIADWNYNVKPYLNREVYDKLRR